jgi:hypothetical protein
MIGTLLAELMTLSVIIFAAVAWIKQTGIRGRALTFAAFAFGLLLGLTYRWAVAPMLTFADWFWAVVFGLMAGFLATGAYKGAESASGKTMMDYPYLPDYSADPDYDDDYDDASLDDRLKSVDTPLPHPVSDEQ